VLLVDGNKMIEMMKSGIAREELFLTTKVWVEHYGYEECKKSVF
jgi:2,5-diketo-D-gluconate reductase A